MNPQSDDIQPEDSQPATGQEPAANAQPEPAVEAVPAPASNNTQPLGDRAWYAIHTYAGYENAVARNLKQRIESLGMEDRIFNVIVPTEKKIKVKANKRVEEEEKIYPGYVLVEMIFTRD